MFDIKVSFLLSWSFDIYVSKPDVWKMIFYSKTMESFLFIIMRNHGYEVHGGNLMAKCPKCGTMVSSPKKKWTMAGRPDKAGKRIQLEIGLFDCPKCHKPFREVLSKKKI